MPFVEVRYGGWDNHQNIFNTLKDDKLPQLDRALSALVADLDSRGLLGHTALVCMGEFGRTPRINGDAGRDHWARSWSVVVGGAGIAIYMYANVFERRREIGTLMALGAGSSLVLRAFLLKALLLGLAGGIGGAF